MTRSVDISSNLAISKVILNFKNKCLPLFVQFRVTVPPDKVVAKDSDFR